MTYDADAKALAIKTIGTVESNLNYQAVNYNDPITVGFMQWYGTRAAAILGRIRTENAASWVGVAESLTTALDTYHANDGNYWTNRYLTRAEGESLRPILNNNKEIQNQQAIDDLSPYESAAVSAGMNPDTNTQGVLFFFVMYHQSPRRALGVIRGTGPASDIDRLYAAVLNEPILGQYRSRYTTARDIIKSGDSTGIEIPPDPELPPPPVGGDPGGDATVRPGGPVQYVRVVGDALHIHFSDAHVLVALPTGSGLWRPTKDATVGADVPPAPENPTPEVPPGTGGGTAVQAALVEFFTSRLNRYSYSQGASRLDPEANMYTDCSGLTYFAYQQVAGINIGTYTGSQYQAGTAVAQGSGTLDESLLQPGDLVFFDWSGGRNTVDHVDMYIGGGNVCGHGGPDSGPDVETLAPRIANAVKYYVRRYV